MATDLVIPGGWNERPQVSPQVERAAQIALRRNAREGLISGPSPGPSYRQQTQSEVLNVLRIVRRMGDPFTMRTIPFEVMRDMADDPMLAFAYFYIVTPLIRADWSYQCEDAQLAAAADAAFRPLMSGRIVGFANSLRYGAQPAIKNFKLGKLDAKYRDPNAVDTEQDKPVWTSSVDVLLPKPLTIVPIENCIPRWDDTGNFAGFYYSPWPIPDPRLTGAQSFTQAMQFQLTQGYEIPLDRALWVVNEQEEVFGSIYGSPRIKRAYRYWWSYWFRWALADRSYENKADPAKIVYFPTDLTEAIDSADPNLGGTTPPTPMMLRQIALDLGQNTRSGATLAVPGDFAVGDDGKTLNSRKWEIKYLEGGENFDLLDNTFQHLDVLKVRSMFIPEQALLEGRGGTSSRNVAAQLGEVYQESQQLLADLYDSYHNDYELPQWIAANFPEKADIPIRKVTSGLGALDSEMIKQVLTLVGQVKGYMLPIDIYKVLEKEGFPMMTKAQQEQQIKEVAEMAKVMAPPQMAPSPSDGTAGYNAGIEKTETGESIYVQPRGQILLSESSGFLNSLPDIPPYRDPSVRSAAMRMRKMLLSRYQDQINSIADGLADRTTMYLTDPQQQQELPSSPQGTISQNGVGKTVAEAIVATIIAAWLAQQTADAPEAALKLAGVIGNVIAIAGKSSLKLARLDQSVFNDKAAVDSYAESKARTAVNSIDNTVRSELATFLVDELQHTTEPSEIATSLREHFADLPATHTERAVRAELRDAYNFGMLRAGIDAGIDQVQAHDASDGGNKATDKRCIERNGKVFTPQEALLEQEHPNGTLYFTYLSTSDFSVELCEAFPTGVDVPDDMHATYDAGSETLYVKLSAVDNAHSYLLAIGDRLSLK